MMHPPFTAEQFFDVFRRYNEAVWPAQIALIAVGLFTVFAAWRANARRSWRWARVALVLLAALWLWTGIAYFKMFFVSITPAGEIFGSLFIAEAGLLLISTWQNGTPFERTSPANFAVAACVIAYALLLYPLLGFALGHRYPAMPTFGAPCPMVIFTFGVFCLVPAAIPRFAVAVPVLWAMLGSYAAFGFGVREDLGLVAAAVAALAVIHHETHRTPVARPAVR
jgi:hypothetical protein